MNWNKNGFLISDDKNLIDIEVVVDLLSRAYWSQGRTRNMIENNMVNAICFGVYRSNKQIGYARVITDKTSLSWICDVIIHEDYRGNGLG